MKNTFLAVVAVLCVFLSTGAGTKAQDQAAPPPAGTPTTATAAPGATAPQGRKKRVAIFDFDYATVQTASAAAFGTNVDVGKGITDLLVKYLVQDGTYSVIERQALDKILAEQNFSNSDRANPNSAAKIGKLLGVDAIIVGASRNSVTTRRTPTWAAAAADLADLVSAAFRTRTPRLS